MLPVRGDNVVRHDRRCARGPGGELVQLGLDRATASLRPLRIPLPGAQQSESAAA
jgi:hypothetical protein